MSHGPLIHIPRPAPLIVPLRRAIGVRGLVTCVLHDAVTGEELLRHGPFKNTYTNAGLDLFSSYGLNTSIFEDGGSSFLAASTDTAAPVATDTVLAGEITPQASNRTSASGLPATSFGYNNSGSPDFFFVKLTRVFGSTQGNGNITKLGLFKASSGSTLLAETLITDAGGTPTMIPKIPGTTLTVTWEFDWIPPQADTVTTTAPINGVVYTLTSRACNVAAGSAAWQASQSIVTLGGFLGTSAGSAVLNPITALSARNASPVHVGSSVTPTKVAYVAGSFLNDYQYVNAAATTAGLALNQAASTTNTRDFLQIGFSPVIPINQQITIRVAWGRYP